MHRPATRTFHIHPLTPSCVTFLLLTPAVELDPEAGSPDDHAAKEARAAHRRELRGLALNALSTLFGTGMSLFAKISGVCS